VSAIWHTGFVSSPSLRSFLTPLQTGFQRVDLQEHKDKILVLLALVISALVGLVVVGFVALTEHLGSILLTASPLRRFLSPLIGSLVGGWLLYNFFPDARGSGIPQTRVALILQKGYISIRTVIGKFICSSISLGSGVALGREGPSVHIGAGIASFAGRKLGLSEEQVRSLIPVGTAAAVAAAFNTPLAAVLFTLEEILADLHARLVGSVVIGAATSWIILRLILGDEPLFHVPAYQLVHPVEFVLYALLGVVGGVISAAFVRLLLWQRAMFSCVPQRWKAFTPLAGGLVVGLLALAQPGVLGVGYNLVSEALNGRMELKLMLLLLLLKVIATTTCYGSGNAGGVFGPSLFIGAMLGGAMGQASHAMFPDYTGDAGAYALVGMGAAFAGIVRTPMTSVIMIFEVTRDYTIIVPLMIANLCSYLLSQKLLKLPLYEALSRQDGITMPSPGHLPELLTVDQAMTSQDSEWARPVGGSFVHPDDPLDAALQRMGDTKSDTIFVVSRTGGTFLGILHKQQILAAYEKRPEEKLSASRPSQNWVAVIAAITLTAVFIIAGLVFWQRSRQSSSARIAFQEGQTMLAQGQVDAAVVSFRNALAHTPEDVELRAALGLALVESGNLQEAASYLRIVVDSQPQNGPVRAALAKIEASSGDTQQALRIYQQALASSWTPQQYARHRNAQMEYATLLSEVGRGREAIALLLSVVEQSGNEAAIGKRAVEFVRKLGNPSQVEAAYTALAIHFPSDATVWMALGDARYAMGDDGIALEAYRNALKADTGNPDAQNAIARLEESLRIDPTGKSLSIRERARRWDLILERIIQVATPCADPRVVDNARALLKRSASRLDLLDQKVEAIKQIEDAVTSSCPADLVLEHVLSKAE